jgi:hypothetical protein
MEFTPTHVSKPVKVFARIFERVQMIMENHGTRRAYHCTMTDGTLEYLLAGDAGKISPAAGRYLVSYFDGDMKVIEPTVFERRYTLIAQETETPKPKAKPKGETK